jgi:hypothetical protein
MIKFPAQYRAGNRLRVTAHGGWRPVSRGRNAGWDTAWQPSLAGQTACAARCNVRAPGARRRGHHVRGCAVACSPTAWRFLDGGKVLPETSRGPQGRCRARRRGQGHTGTVSRRRGGRRVPGWRRSPAGRELRWSWSSVMRSCSSGGARG